MKRILANTLPVEIQGRRIFYISFASFEQRCLTAISNLPRDRVGMAIVLFNRANSNPKISENLKIMNAHLDGAVKEIAVNLADPFDIREQVINALSSIDRVFDQFVLDVTTFTHEALAITVDMLSERWPDQSWSILYNGAADYDPAHNDPDEIWLSKRPSGVRSVLGFSGEMHPSRKLHLLIFVGFEHERARYAIEAFEPNTITLGLGEKSQSVSDTLADLNAHFFKKVDSFAGSMAATYSRLNKVTFSCTDPQKTLDVVRKVVADSLEFNTIICPMNTKLSTLGVVLAAMENPSIQLAYVPVDEYNEDAYATPSEFLTVDNIVFRKKAIVR